MRETEKVELDSTYDAVVVLLRLTERASFPFRIALLDEAEWVRSRALSEHASTSPTPRADHHELVRCSAEEAPGVFQQVVRIATAPMFNDRCRNKRDEPPALDPTVSRFVLFLTTDVGFRANSGSEEPTLPGVPRSMSGVHPKIRAAKSA